METLEKKMQAAKQAQEVNTFDVPEKLAAATGVSQVGLVTLNADEELLCYKKARGDNAKLASELAKSALVEVDGKRLQTTDGTVDSFWKVCDPRLRMLILAAYTELHAAEQEDADSFLKSRKLRVG